MLLRGAALYEPIGTDKEGNHISLLDIICTDEAAMIEKFIYRQYLIRLNEMVERLPDAREREIIVRRYGLHGGEAHTQKEVAAELGISRSYVSRIEKRALEKLKTCYEQQM